MNSMTYAIKYGGRRVFVGLVFGLAGLTGFPGLVLSGCESPANPLPPTSTEPDISGVVYEGLATDEALVILLGFEAQSDPAQNVVCDYPAAKMSLPAATAATFAWHIGESARLWPPSLHDWALAVDAMITPRQAHAHGAPINGRGYFLVFSTPSAPKLLRVFTTELTYTPDATAWATLVAAGGPISLTITNAIFEDNRVAQDGGPFAGPGISFSITP
jgi:hypothetical protein